MFALLMLPMLAPEPVEPPMPAPVEAPRLVRIKAGGSLVRTVIAFETVNRTVTVEKVVDGKKVVETVTVAERVPVMKTVEEKLGIASVSTAAGKKLVGDDAKKALDKDQVVLLASGPVDPAFLKALKDDTLVIVEKRAARPKPPVRPADPARD